MTGWRKAAQYAHDLSSTWELSWATMNGQAEEQISRYTGRCDSIHLMYPQVRVDTGAEGSLVKSPIESDKPRPFGCLLAA